MFLKVFSPGLFLCLAFLQCCHESSQTPSDDAYVKDLIASLHQQTGLSLKDGDQEVEAYVRDLMQAKNDDEQMAWSDPEQQNEEPEDDLFARFPRRNLDPDARRDLTELISSQGYPVEKYVVQTKDGFLLDLHRIPYGRNQVPGELGRGVVFLQHGLISSACDWVLNFYNNSLGFVLADHGYDVWMGNTRGNTYSKQHISLSPEDEKFWDWSFDEMAKYDTPAFIDFILEKTSQPNLYYVGHSQGTVMAFALFSIMPEYQKKVRLFVGLAPIISVKHMRSPAKFFLKDDEEMYKMFGRKEVFGNNLATKIMADTLCNNPKTRWFCVNMFFLMNGYDRKNLNTTRMPVYVNHSPAGASAKAIVHFSQMYNQGKFTMYNYGSSLNLRHYRKISPPEYDISNITVPSLLFSGPHDWLADPKDVNILLAQLPNIQAHYVIPRWNHLDYVWALNARPECYDKILKWFLRF